MLMFESHRLTNRFPVYRIMPELQGNLKNDDRTPIRFNSLSSSGFFIVN